MVIDLQHVSLIKKGKTLLNDVNWQVKSGEHWAILGLNGSGKTTLLNIINGYIWPSKGTVSVLDKKFGEYPLDELRKSIGWVSTSFQDKLYGHEYIENVVLSGAYASIGLWEDPTQEEIDRALQLIEDFGLTTFIKRPIESLSQGEKQKVFIARALMASPKLLILDEPCTGLDVFAREQLLDSISVISQRADAPTLLYVTHHIEEILPVFTHSILIKKGEVYAADRKENILNSESLSTFFNREVEVSNEDERFYLKVKQAQPVPVK